MELKQLKAFVSIATLRSFRGAANRLNLSQPAISLRIKALETELGTRLFERPGNKVQLTGAGLKLLIIAEEILEGERKLKATASGTLEPHQRVRLGVTSTIASAWLCELIEEVQNAHSHLVIDIVVDTTRNLRSQLTLGEIDVAILMGPVHESHIRNVPLKAYQNKWIAGKELEIPEGQLTLNQIVEFPIITYAKDSATYGSLEEALLQSGIGPTIISSCSSVETILKLVGRNKFIGIISEACLPDNRVEIINCEMPLPEYEYFISYHLDSIGRVGMAVADIAKRISSL